MAQTDEHWTASLGDRFSMRQQRIDGCATGLTVAVTGRLRASSVHRSRTEGDRTGRREAVESASLRNPVDHASDTAIATALSDPGIALQLVHHDDVVAAIALAATTSAPAGTYNIAGDDKVTLSNIAAALGGRPIRIPAATATIGSAVVARLPFLPPKPLYFT
jgi:nucleoside-diphosphate-sugar epimerase